MKSVPGDRIFLQLTNYFSFHSEYPWTTETLKRLQEMAWLPDPDLRNHTHRLVLDFLLLMCTCRQLLVFRIEKQYENSEFMGGSNKSVVDDINKLGSGEVPIQTHDFVSIQKTWLDIVKCIVFLGCFWITLAIVFLAGTNHVNIFSIGYLIGSFIFLWQGADFYLRPIHVILRWWKYLVAYNVFVITMKIVLHLPVCIFIRFFESNRKEACFLKIFGITCSRSIDIYNPLRPPQVNFGHLVGLYTIRDWNFIFNLKINVKCFILSVGNWLRCSKRRIELGMGLRVLHFLDIPIANFQKLLFLSYNQRK